MKRKIDVSENIGKLNFWVRRSIGLFNDTAYIDNIQGIYPFEIAQPQRLDQTISRELIAAHHNRDTKKLISLLVQQKKFPYEEPVWYLLKNIKGCLEKNPRQVRRIATSLYSMTAEETIMRLESPPDLNTQVGPMFYSWLRRAYKFIKKEDFKNKKRGIYILDASEEEGKQFVEKVLGQSIEKRPDLVAKVNEQYIIGEAKWIGQPGGNQEKQVQEVLKFCKNQRGRVRRIGIVDGFPWALYNRNERLIESKEAILIQESPYDILSALLIKDYFKQFS